MLTKRVGLEQDSDQALRTSCIQRRSMAWRWWRADGACEMTANGYVGE